MRRSILALVLLLASTGIFGQGMELPPALQVLARQPNVTLQRFVDSLETYQSPSDTGEGGEESKTKLFLRYWQDRVSKTDSSGASMFEKYAYALRAVTN